MDDEDDELIGDWVSLGTPEWTRERHKDYLLAALLKERHELDNLTATVVGGTLLEYYLRRLISTKADVDVLEPKGKAPIAFGMLVRIARSVDVLPGWFVKPLMALMTLRNTYAHEIAYKLQEQDIQRLRSAVADTPLQSDWIKLEQKSLREAQPKLERTVGFQLRIFIICLADRLLDTIDWTSACRPE